MAKVPLFASRSMMREKVCGNSISQMPRLSDLVVVRLPVEDEGPRAAAKTSPSSSGYDKP